MSPRKTYLTAVHDTAVQMNWHRGYGDIQNVRLAPHADNVFEFTIVRPFVRETVRRGFVRNGRLHFLGTSKKIDMTGVKTGESE